MRPGRTDALEETVYQIRTGPDFTSEDVLNAVVQAVWWALREQAERPPYPGLCPEMCDLLRDVFRNHVSRYERCGRTKLCRAAPERVFWPGGGPPGAETRIYLLGIYGGVDGLFHRIAEVSGRCLLAKGLPQEKWVLWESRVRKSLRDALGRYLYFGPNCQDCGVRQGAGVRGTRTAAAPAGRRA